MSKESPDGPRIVFLDIETAPETAYIWKRFKESVGESQILHHGYLLCIAWEWLNSNKIESCGLYGGKAWKEGRWDDDREVVQAAWNVLDQADIVCGQNIRQFDIATLNARFAYYDMGNPSPFKVVDTLEVMKKHIRLPSRSLETASHYFGIDYKDKQTFSLWRDCLLGKRQAWRDLIRYCGNDVHVLKQLYFKLRPWMDTHPNVALWMTDGTQLRCTNCGSTKLQRRGFVTTMVNRFARFHCTNCGAWMRERHAEKFVRGGIATHAVVS